MTEQKQRRKPRKYTDEFKKQPVTYIIPVNADEIFAAIFPLAVVSNYTTAQFKPQKDRCNESKVENVLKRRFRYIHLLVLCSAIRFFWHKKNKQLGMGDTNQQ